MSRKFVKSNFQLGLSSIQAPDLSKVRKFSHEEHKNGPGKSCSSVVSVPSSIVSTTSNCSISGDFQFGSLGNNFHAVTKKSAKPENQDCILKYQDKDVLALGVLDGHGKFGKECARRLTRFFVKEIKMSVFKDVENIESKLIDSFLRAHTHLAESSDPNVHFRWSGSTVTIALILGSELIIANVGDSEAVMGTTNAKPLILTTSHRPTDEKEMKRIKDKGGRIEPQRDHCGNILKGPLRVWMKDIQTPGLMISRSLGDLVSHESIGIISEPSIHRAQLSNEYDVLIIARDCVWDLLGQRKR